MATDELRVYETLYIIHPDVPEEEVETMARQLESLVTDGGGEVVKGEIWGKRRLAYKVGKCGDGYFVLLRFKGLPALVQRIESHFRLAEKVIRHLLLHFDEHTLRLEERQQQRKEAEIRSSVAAGQRRRVERPAREPVKAVGAPGGAEKSDEDASQKADDDASQKADENANDKGGEVPEA